MQHQDEHRAAAVARITDKREFRNHAFIDRGRFITCGIGVSLLAMRSPDRARARVPVSGGPMTGVTDSPTANSRNGTKIYEAPLGKSFGDWQEVFDDAQPLQWTAFNTGRIHGALKNNAQPDSFPLIAIPTRSTGTR